jgi:hypothetical protein
VVIDEVAVGFGSCPALHLDGDFQTGSSLEDSSGVWGVEGIEYS